MRQARTEHRSGHRTHLAAALLALVPVLAAAACGSSSPGAPSSTVGTSHNATTSSPIVQTVVPDTPVGSQLAWLLKAASQLPIPASALDTHFAPSFLAKVDPSTLDSALARLASAGSPTFVGLLPVSTLASPSDSIQAVVAFGTTEVTASMALDASGQIAGLLFSPYVPTTLDSWTAVDSALVGVAPGTGLVAARLGPTGTCTPVHGLDASVVRPTGSMFKLFVLGAVAARIAAGAVHWDQELTLTDALRSSGSGTLQLSPSGTRLTVRQAADRMISQSDNTAADLLIHLVGRPAVEAQVGAWSRSAALDRPFLTTREAFVLKEADYPVLADAYVALTPSDRTAYLVSTVDPQSLPASTGGWTAPRSIDSIEWFASPDDLCRAFAGLAAQQRQSALAPIASVLSINEGGLALDPRHWSTVWFKGGSEPGVLALGYLARQSDGTSDIVVAMAEDTASPLDGTASLRMQSVVKAAFGLLG